MNKGFTLIELIITITIGILMVGISILGLANFYGSQSLESDAKGIEAMLKTAQNQSINQQCNSRWGVSFDNLDRITPFYYLYKVDNTVPAATGCPDNAGTIFETVYLKSNAEFSTPVPDSSSTVIFSKATGLPDAAYSVVIFEDSDINTIFIRKNGSIDYQ